MSTGDESIYDEFMNRKKLKEDYNIILKHQVPNSPETNLLDLGVWRALQSAVENLSHQKRFDHCRPHQSQ